MASHTDLRIVLVGKTGSGKSSAGNTILGQKKFKHDTSLESVTKTCESGEVEHDGKRISVFDTPGQFDTSVSEEEMKAEIEKCVEMSVPGPHAFLLVIRLDVKFTEEEKNTVKWIQKNFGEEAARYTIILFTHDDVLEGKHLNEYISKSNDLKALVNECGDRIHSFNNKDIENHSQVTELLKKIDEMVKRNGGQHYTSEIYKKAQQKIKWECFIQKVKHYGQTALMVGGAAVGARAGAAGATAVAAAGEGAVAVARAAVAAAARGAAAGGGVVAATQAGLGL